MNRFLSTLLVRLRDAAQPDAERVSDAEVLARFVRDRDTAAFELLVWRHGPMIWGVCKRLLGNSPDAEDAYQAAFVVLARKASSIARGEALASWLHRVAWRTALNARTARQRRSAHERPMTGLLELPAARVLHEQHSCRDDPVRRMVNEELKGLIDGELLKLPEKFRLPVLLCDLEGLSNEEAATVCNCPLGTLNSRLARGRAKLRDRLGRYGMSKAEFGVVAVPPAVSAILDTPSELVRALADGAIHALRVSAMKKAVAGLVLCVALFAGLAFGGFAAKEGVRRRAAPPALPADNASSAKTDARPAAANLAPQAVVIGKVVDGAGKPIAGATVTAVGAKKSQPATSGLDGGFRLPLGYPANKAIYTTLLARGRNGWLGYLSIWQANSKPVQVIIKPAHKLIVDVMDGDNKPVADAEVCFLADLRQLLDGRTDAADRWNGRIPADASVWAVFARKSKVGFDYERARESPGKPAQPLPGHIRLRLDGARTLRVKTVDQHGKPIAGVKVGPGNLYKPNREDNLNHSIHLSGTRAFWPETDKDGVVVLDWLPERFGHGFDILTESEDRYAPDHGIYISRPKPVDTVTITLLPLESLSGRVTYPNGRPAAGVHVLAAGGGAGVNSFRGSTQTDAEGRYMLKVYSEQAYIVVAADKQLAAPYRGGIIVRAGRPVAGIDFVLGKVTRVHGRVTVGTKGLPVAKTYLSARIDLGEIPAALRRKGDRHYHGVSLSFRAVTDKDGRYEFHFGPGEYTIHGPVRTKPASVTIPAKNTPAEIVRDFRMPREETGPLAGLVSAGGRPVAGALVNGRYASHEARTWFEEVKTDKDGRFSVTRSLDPLVLHARTSDGTQAGVVRIGAEAAKVEIQMGPVAAATGRLLDLKGNALAGKKLEYGIRIYQGEPEHSPFSDNFGGTATTDGKGRFTLRGLIPAQTYEVSLPVDEHNSRSVTRVEPKSTRGIDLGDLRVDPEPRKPYVPPTPTQRAAKAFAPRQSTTPRERKQKVLAESSREYTRAMLLFGSPKDPACIDLFRLFTEEEDASGGKSKHPPSPMKLRWEFELASLDTDQPEVVALARDLGITTGKGRSPILAVLNADGSLAATYPLVLDKKQQLDSPALSAFLVKHKPAMRNAESMLADALKKAKVQKKRVFFIVSASWCGPCRLLSRFLASRKKELEQHFIFVKVDISRDEHADPLRKRYQGDNDGGVPWYVILDGDGKALITSNTTEVKRGGKSANIGFPSSAAGIAHFLRMLKETAPSLSGEQLAELRKALAKE